MELKPLDTIVVTASSISCRGPGAVQVYRLATLVSALRLEIRVPGLKWSRHGSALKFAKSVTGLKTNDRAKQLERVQLMLTNAKAQVLHVGTTVQQ